MTFDAFIATAWDDHANDPETVADRLTSALGDVQSPPQIAAYVRLVTHVYGEHLGRWDDGIALLGRLAAAPFVPDDAPSRAAIDRNAATLRFAGGDAAALDHLANADRISAIAVASSALAGRGDFARSAATLTHAARLADAGLPDDSPAIRAIAITGNNLAATLEQHANRSDEETQAMVEAARIGLAYWQRAGGWLEEERAQYRLAMSLLSSGDATSAAHSAQRCVDVCRLNAAPDFEIFFAYAALALAQRTVGNTIAADSARTQALAAYANVPAGEQQWCKADLEALSA